MINLRLRFALLVILSAAGYLLSFCSQVVISYYFGTSAELDGYWAALALVNLLCFYVHPFREALVPSVYRACENPKSNAGQVLSAGMSFLAGGVVISAAVLFASAGLFSSFISLIGGGRSAASLQGLLPWLLPFLGLYVFSEALNTVLISFDRAVLQAIVRLLTASAFLVVVGLLGSFIGVPVLLLGQITAMGLSIAVCIMALRNLHMRLTTDVVSILSRSKVFPLFMALLANYFFAQVYVMGERTAMIYLSQGLVSAYQYSTSLVNVLISMSAYPLANALWPRFLAQGEGASDADELGARAVGMLFLTLLVVCTFVWTHADQIIFLLFHRGSFGADSSAQTSYALRATIFAAIPIGIMAVLGRLLISSGNGRSQVMTGLAITIVGLSVIGLALWLHSIQLVQWHWLAANMAGLVVCLTAYSRQRGLSRLGLLRSAGWIMVVVLATCAAAVLTPRFETSGDKMHTLAALAAEGTIYVLIAWTTVWVSGAIRPLKTVEGMRLLTAKP